jgi:hypothetical protein
LEPEDILAVVLEGAVGKAPSETGRNAMQRLVFTSVVLALSAGLSLAQAATTVVKQQEVKTNYGAAGGMKIDPTTTGGTSNAAKDCAPGQQVGSAKSSAPGQAEVDAKVAAPGQMKKTAEGC